MNNNISGFNSYKEEFLVNNVIKFFIQTFGLSVDLEEFYNATMNPFFKSEYDKGFIRLHFPIESSPKQAEVRIKLLDCRTERSLSYKLDSLFNNIIFDYNIEFKKEIYNIHNLSVEDVFETKLYCLEDIYDKRCEL